MHLTKTSRAAAWFEEECVVPHPKFVVLTARGFKLWWSKPLYSLKLGAVKKIEDSHGSISVELGVSLAAMKALTMTLRQKLW